MTTNASGTNLRREFRIHGTPRTGLRQQRKKPAGAGLCGTPEEPLRPFRLFRPTTTICDGRLFGGRLTLKTPDEFEHAIEQTYDFAQLGLHPEARELLESLPP